MNDWPFDQPPDCAVATTAGVMRKGRAILRVYHDAEDHGWQFHAAGLPKVDELMLVALEEVVALDATVLEVADLPPGWMAERDGRDAPWRRKRQSELAVITVEWPKIDSQEAFYDCVLDQCGSPGWHGRNLDALADSWITGGIDAKGPPYHFRFIGGGGMSGDLAKFRNAVQEIARKSVAENGGEYVEE